MDMLHGPPLPHPAELIAALGQFRITLHSLVPEPPKQLTNDINLAIDRLGDTITQVYTGLKVILREA